MTPRPIRPAFLAAVAAAAVLLSACGGSTASPSPAATSSPTGTPIPPGESGGPPTAAPSAVPSAVPSAAPTAAPELATLLLEVSTEGGFINPSANIAALPALVVDADGRIFTPAVAADGSTPLIPQVEVRDTGKAGAAAILAALRAAGLDTEKSGGVAADAGSSVFTVVIGGATIVSRFAAGGPGGPGAPGASGAPGAAAFALLTRLLDPAETWGNSTASAAKAFTPQGYLVFVAPVGAAPAGSAAWPLATAPGAFGSPAAQDRGVTGLRQGTVIGAEASKLAIALAKVPAGGVLATGTKGWSTWIRPLFPDELGG